MVKPRRGRATPLWTCAALATAFAFAYVGAQPTPSAAPGAGASLDLVARAQAQDIDWGYDLDEDGLSDEVESVTGSDFTVADTDGDGYGDGAEWVLGADPADPGSLPDPRPAVRSTAYEVGDKIRVFCAVFPANLDLVQSFCLLIGSTSFEGAPEGDPGSGIGIYDASGLLGGYVGSFTQTTYLGLSLVGFDFDLDRTLLLAAGDLYVAWTARIAEVVVVDQLLLGVEGATEFVLAAGSAAPGSGSTLVAQPLALVPPPGDEIPEYCAVGFSDGTSVGLASVQYDVTSAECEPDGLLYCIDDDCTSLEGQSFLLIDYGYLQSRADS
jgi:hypothetical protein